MDSAKTARVGLGVLVLVILGGVALWLNWGTLFGEKATGAAAADTGTPASRGPGNRAAPGR